MTQQSPIEASEPSTPTPTPTSESRALVLTSAEAVRACVVPRPADPTQRELLAAGRSVIARHEGVEAAWDWWASFDTVMARLWGPDGGAAHDMLAEARAAAPLDPDVRPEVVSLVALLLREADRLASAPTGRERQVAFALAAMDRGTKTMRAAATAWLAREESALAWLRRVLEEDVSPLREGTVASMLADHPIDRGHLATIGKDRFLTFGGDWPSLVQSASARAVTPLDLDDASANDVCVDAAGTAWIGDSSGKLWRLAPDADDLDPEPAVHLPSSVDTLVALAPGLVVAWLCDGTVWRCVAGSEPTRLAEVAPAALPCTARSAVRLDDRRVALAGVGGVHEIDVRTGARTLHCTESLPGHVAVDPDGTLVATPIVGLGSYAWCLGERRHSFLIAEGHCAALPLGDATIAVFRYRSEDDDAVELAIVSSLDGAIVRSRAVPFGLPAHVRRVGATLLHADGHLVDLETLDVVGSVSPRSDVARLSIGAWVHQSWHGRLAFVSDAALRGARVATLPVRWGRVVEVWSTARARVLHTTTGEARDIVLPWVPDGGAWSSATHVVLWRTDRVSQRTFLVALDAALGEVTERGALEGVLHACQEVERGDGLVLFGERVEWQGDDRQQSAFARWGLDGEGAVTGEVLGLDACPESGVWLSASFGEPSAHPPPREKGLLWAWPSLDEGEPWAGLGYGTLSCVVPPGGPLASAPSFLGPLSEVVVVYDDGRFVLDVGSEAGLVVAQMHRGEREAPACCGFEPPELAAIGDA